MTKQKFIEQLKEKDLAHHLEKFIGLIRNCISLLLLSADEGTIPLGESKIGGRPDLPKSISWATEEDGKPLSFIAQVNLAEVSSYDVDNLLPRKGILYFFYSA